MRRHRRPGQTRPGPITPAWVKLIHENWYLLAGDFDIIERADTIIAVQMGVTLFIVGKKFGSTTHNWVSEYYLFVEIIYYFID